MNRQMRKSGVGQTLKRHMNAILTANQRKYSRIATHFTDEITIPSMQADRAHILPIPLQPGTEILQAADSGQNFHFHVGQFCQQRFRAAVKAGIAGEKYSERSFCT